MRSAGSLAILMLGLAFLSGCDSAEKRATAYYENGVKLAASGEPVKASLEFRNALKLNKDYVDALFALGKVEEQQGHFDAAAKIYVAVAEHEPNHVQARVRLVYILTAAGLLDKAQEYADQAFALADTDPSVLVAKAAVALKLDNRGDAVHLSEAALQQDPENADALALLASERLMSSDPAGALKFLDKGLSKSESNVGLQLLRLSALDSLGDESAVEKVFVRLTELYPETPVFTISLVRWYLTKGRKDDAERVLRQYAVNNPQDEKAQLDLVAFLNTERGADAAREQLRALVDRGGNVFAYQMALGQLQFVAGDHAGAVDLMKSLVAGTDNAQNRNKARVQLARMMATTEDWAEANRLTDAVLADDPKNVDALSLRGSVRLQNGKNADAIEDLTAALNEAPDSSSLQELLGDAYERSGAVDLAEEQYSKALELQRYAPAPGLRMAQFLMRYGKVDQAERVLEQVRANTPTDRQVLSLLAQLKLTRQDWVGAQEIADALKTLDNSGEDQTANQILAAALGGQNKLEESIRVLETSLPDASNRQAVLSDLIRAYARAGKIDVAEGLLKTNDRG